MSIMVYSLSTIPLSIPTIRHPKGGRTIEQSETYDTVNFEEPFAEILVTYTASERKNKVEASKI
jgi:hypothetical protein